ncbi:hypothetical protein FB451DRAFT_1537901, partial [Mycena latifolia]
KRSIIIHNRGIFTLNFDHPEITLYYGKDYGLGYLPLATRRVLQMPPATRRTGRTESLLKAYVQNSKGRQHRALLRQRAAARIRQENPKEPSYHVARRDTSSSDSSDSESSSDSSSKDWSDIGPDWRFVDDTVLDGLSIETDSTSDSQEISDMPELRSIGSGSSDSQSESDWASSAGSLGDAMSGVE